MKEKRKWKLVVQGPGYGMNEVIEATSHRGAKTTASKVSQCPGGNWIDMSPRSDKPGEDRNPVTYYKSISGGGHLSITMLPKEI